MCIGNRDGGDDSAGPYIADRLKKIHNKDLFVIDCDTVPENYTSVVKSKKPDNLIIIDAVEMGLKPGDIRIVPKEKIGTMHISTHNIPLSVLITYFESFVNNITRLMKDKDFSMSLGIKGRNKVLKDFSIFVRRLLYREKLSQLLNKTG